MDPFNRNFSSLLNQGSSSQATENESQNSPRTQFPTNFPQYLGPNYLQNFNPFGPPTNYQPYGHPPIFQGAYQQDYYGQTTAASFQGSLNQVFGFSGSRSQFAMQYSTSPGVATNTYSHGPGSARVSSSTPYKKRETSN